MGSVSRIEEHPSHNEDYLCSPRFGRRHRLSKLAARRALAAASSMVLMPATASSPGKSPSASEDMATSAVEPSLETNTSSALLTASDKPRTLVPTPSAPANGT